MFMSVDNHFTFSILYSPLSVEDFCVVVVFDKVREVVEPQQLSAIFRYKTREDLETTT